MAEGQIERVWHARYDQWAVKYNEDHLIAGWSPQGLSRRLALVLRLLSTSLKPGSLILDLGAGPGTYTRAITKTGHRCLGLDYSFNVLKAARRKSKAESYVQGEAYGLPFHDGVFDAVVCIGVLQSLAEPAAALSEMKRVLAPGGHLFLDGLNSLLWIHRLRKLIAKLIRKEEKLNYWNPCTVRRQAEMIGFTETRLHWLTVMGFFQYWFNKPREAEFLFVARSIGHAFLLHARKTQG